ncbi:MAG TPA: T9SS type A sorting domain-containing protein, partial [Bacteroidota bacterium]|nr:T9SS type A sorting domain-containing protein [Bacteroidota bacterium]
YGGWDSFTPNTGPSIITLGPLDSLTAARLLGRAITSGADFAAAEAARNIDVKNNVYFWSSGLTSFWTTWNDTAHADSIYTPLWMNASTAAMFANHTSWPGFVQSGNQNIDPGFGASIAGILNSGVGNGNGLLNWFASVRNGTGTTQTYGYQITQVSGAANWTPTWPLPEKTDLATLNATLLTGGTDGKQVGDPYWISGLTGVKAKTTAKPTTFSLAPAYPNPFNPATMVQYTLAKPGFVSLKVYNILGQLVRTIVDNAYQAPQTYRVRLDMNGYDSGVYMCVLEQGGNRAIQKLMLVK